MKQIISILILFTSSITISQNNQLSKSLFKSMFDVVLINNTFESSFNDIKKHYGQPDKEVIVDDKSAVRFTYEISSEESVEFVKEIGGNRNMIVICFSNTEDNVNYIKSSFNKKLPYSEDKQIWTDIKNNLQYYIMKEEGGLTMIIIRPLNE